MSPAEQDRLRRLEARVERLTVQKDLLLKLVKRVLERLRTAGA